MQNVKLKGTGISIQFGSTYLLNSANFELPIGKTVGIGGITGSGKSSLLRVIGLLDSPVAGEIRYEDIYNCGNLPIKQKNKLIGKYFSYIFQEPELMMNWSAIQNVALPLIARGESRNRAYSQARELCDELSISEKLLTPKNAPPVSIASGGEKQRIEIARALAKQPSVLLADEPTASLDSDHAKKIMEMLQVQINKRKIACAIVSHDKEILNNCDCLYHILGTELQRTH